MYCTYLYSSNFAKVIVIDVECSGFKLYLSAQFQTASSFVLPELISVVLT